MSELTQLAFDFNDMLSVFVIGGLAYIGLVIIVWVELAR